MDQREDLEIILERLIRKNSSAFPSGNPYKAIHDEWATQTYEYSSPRAQIVVGDSFQRRDEVNSLLQYAETCTVSKECKRRGMNDAEANRAHTWKVLASISEVKDLVKTYIAIQSSPESTEQELATLQEIETILVQSLVHFLLCNHSSFETDVELFFIELAVTSNCDTTKLAFLLLFNVSLAIASVHSVTRDLSRSDAIHTPDITSIHEPVFLLQDKLYTLLLEMLERFVSTQGNERISCPNCADGTNCAIEVIISAFLHFIYSSEGLQCARVMSVNVHLLRSVLNIVDCALYPQYEYYLMLTLVLYLYLKSSQTNGSKTSKQNDVRRRHSLHAAPAMDYLDPHSSSVHGDRATRRQSGNIFELKSTVDGDPLYCITNDAFASGGGIEYYIQHFFMTHSIEVQQLLFTCFFDLIISQETAGLLVKDDKERNAILNSLLDNNLPTLVAQYPYILYSPNVTKCFDYIKRGSSSNLHSDVECIITSLARVLRIEEYFHQSYALNSAIRVWKLSCEDNNKSPEKLIDTISVLLSSQQPEDRFKGQRFMAELISTSKRWTHTDQVNRKSYSEELNDSPFDEIADIRLAARAAFWSFAKNTNVSIKKAAIIGVLSLASRRDIRIDSRNSVTHVLKEINSYCKVLMEAHQQDLSLISQLCMLLFQITQQPLNYYYEQQLEHNNIGLDTNTTNCTLVECIQSGRIALDRELVHEVSPEFLIYSLQVLERSRHTAACTLLSCHCCNSIVKYISHIVANLIRSVYADQAVFSKTGGMARFIPFLNSFDAKIAILISELLIAIIRDKHAEQYACTVRDMHIDACTNSDDFTFNNKYFYCRQLLLKLYKIDITNCEML